MSAALIKTYIDLAYIFTHCQLNFYQDDFIAVYNVLTTSSYPGERLCWVRQLKHVQIPVPTKQGQYKTGGSTCIPNTAMPLPVHLQQRPSQ